MSVGEQFMLRKETFGPDLLDDQGTAGRLQRAGRRADHAEAADVVRGADPGRSSSWSPRAAWTSKTDVYATAVSGLDDDSADVLVVGDTTFGYQEGQPQTAPFRYQLSLVQTDGEWLVDVLRGRQRSSHEREPVRRARRRPGRDPRADPGRLEVGHRRPGARRPAVPRLQRGRRACCSTPTGGRRTTPSSPPQEPPRSPRPRQRPEDEPEAEAEPVHRARARSRARAVRRAGPAPAGGRPRTGC